MLLSTDYGMTCLPVWDIISMLPFRAMKSLAHTVYYDLLMYTVYSRTAEFLTNRMCVCVACFFVYIRFLSEQMKLSHFYTKFLEVYCE